jgi:hypothetical protein
VPLAAIDGETVLAHGVGGRLGLYEYWPTDQRLIVAMSGPSFQRKRDSTVRAALLSVQSKADPVQHREFSHSPRQTEPFVPKPLT